MNFAQLDYTQYNFIAFLIGFGVPSLLLIIFMVSFEKYRNKHKVSARTEGKIFGIVFISLVAVALVGVLGGENHMNNVLKDNQAKAEQNIMKKYDVKDVEWDSEQTKATPTLAEDSKGKASNELVLVADDGKAYLFRYDLNKETSEPTLKDMPIAGGSTPEDAVSADSLLKNTP